MPQVTLDYLANDTTKSDQRSKLKTTIGDLFAEIKSVSVKKFIRDILKFMSFAKSDTLSTNELMASLLGIDSNYEDLELAVEKLQTLSILPTDATRYVSTNTLLQNIALDFSQYLSLADYLQFISLFKPKTISLRPVLLQLSSYDLAKEAEQIRLSTSGLTVVQKCNMTRIIKLLLKEVQFVKELNNHSEMIVSLKFLEGYFMKNTHEDLQSLIVSKVKDWSNFNKEKNKALLLPKIDELLVLLTSFIEEEYAKINEQFAKSSANVIVIGPTGAGKSTIINHIIGHDLEFAKYGLNGKINVVSKGMNIASIGNDCIISHTDFIAPYCNEKTGITYWDFPGFFDTRGNVKKIQHAFLMRAFSKEVSTSKYF